MCPSVCEREHAQTVERVSCAEYINNSTSTGESEMVPLPSSTESASDDCCSEANPQARAEYPRPPMK